MIYVYLTDTRCRHQKDQDEALERLVFISLKKNDRGMENIRIGIIIYNNNLIAGIT